MNSNLSAAGSMAGRTILVTGAGSGLGAALARAAGTAGAEVILLGRTVRKLEAVYDAIVAAGGPAPAILPLDLEGASPDDYADIAERIETQCTGLDAVVHNAAMLGPLTPLEQYPPLEWLRVLQVNLNGPLFLTQACLPLLRQAAAPKILFIGDEPKRAYWGAYGVSKAALEALGETLAQEVGTGRTPVAVHWVNPGPMRTKMREEAYRGACSDEAPLPEEGAVDQVMALLRE